MFSILSCGRCLPAFPLNAVQHFLRLGENLVEAICRSGDVNDYRVAIDIQSCLAASPARMRASAMGAPRLRHSR